MKIAPAYLWVSYLILDTDLLQVFDVIAELRLMGR